MSDRFEQFSMVISGIYKYVHHIEREEMVKMGYKGSYAECLAALRRYSEGVTSIRLCEICSKDKAAVSRLISEMEEKGLVEREKNGGNYRSKIMLTEKGREVADFVVERARIAVSAVSEGVMNDTERERFYEILDSIEANLKSVCAEGLPD